MGADTPVRDVVPVTASAAVRGAPRTAHARARCCHQGVVDERADLSRSTGGESGIVTFI